MLINVKKERLVGKIKIIKKVFLPFFYLYKPGSSLLS